MRLELTNVYLHARTKPHKCSLLHKPRKGKRHSGSRGLLMENLRPWLGISLRYKRVRDKGRKSSFISLSAWGQDGGYLPQVGTDQKEMWRGGLRDQGEQVFDGKSKQTKKADRFSLEDGGH